MRLLIQSIVMQVKVNGTNILRPRAFADKTEAKRALIIQLIEADLQQITESATTLQSQETEQNIIIPATKRGEKNGLNQVIHYLEQKGSLEVVMRHLETSQDKVSQMALEIFYRDEKEIEEKKRILLKFKEYFQNGETFIIPYEREQLTRLSIRKKLAFQQKEMALIKDEPHPDASQETELLPGQFSVEGEIVQKTWKSLFLFSSKNKFRIALVRMVESEKFNNFIMLSIFLNSVIIAAYDHSRQLKQFNFLLSQIGIFFTAIYTIECLIKIIANGVIVGQNTYLRSPMNLFDLSIVITSFLELTAQESNSAAKAFRIFRALRVLKLISVLYKNKHMRGQIRTLGRALPGFMNVIIFLSLFFILLAIIGLQLFSDDIYNACRLTPSPVKINDRLVWQRAPTKGLSSGGICSKDNSWYSLGGFKCPKQYTCGSYLDYGLPLTEDGVDDSEQLYFNIAIWRDFISSSLAVFQIVSADTWSAHLKNMIYSTEFFTPIVYVFCIHMLGTYYFMNLLLVVIMESYIEQEDIFALDDIYRHKKQITQFKAIVNIERYEKYQQDIYRMLKLTSESLLTIEYNEENGLVYRKSSCIDLEENSIELIQTKTLPMLSFYEHSETSPGSRFESSPALSRFNTEYQKNLQDPVVYLKPSEQRQIKELCDMVNNRFIFMKTQATKISSEQGHELFLEFMVKAIACEMLQVEKQQSDAKTLLKMELDLLVMKFEQIQREQHKKERMARYGLKQESKVIEFLKSNINGLFDDFTSAKYRKKRQKLFQNNDPHQFIARSIEQDKKSVFHIIRRKRQLNFGDEVMLILDIMFRSQTYIQSHLKDNEQISFYSAQDVYLVTKAIEKLEAQDHQAFLEKRMATRNIFQLCFAIDSNSYYQALIALSIVGNTIILATDTYPYDLKVYEWREYLNTVFFFIFLLEMIIKMLGVGLLTYFRNWFSIFDFFVILVSILEMLLEQFNFKQQSFDAIRAFRVFRLLRVFKLAKIWRSFNELIGIFFFTASKIGYLSIIVGLCLVTYAVLCMEIFAYKLSFDSKNRPLIDDFDFKKAQFKQGHSPDFNFDTFLNSLISVFIYITTQGWSGIYYNVARFQNIHPLLPFSFFYSLYIVCKMILYQFFLAILLKEFDRKTMKDKVARYHLQQNQGVINQTLAQIFNRRVPKLVKKDLDTEERIHSTDNTSFPQTFDELHFQVKEIKPQQTVQEDKAFFFLSLQNPLRRIFIWMNEFKIKGFAVLDTIIWIAIASTSIMMAFDSPLADENSRLQVVLKWVDLGMTVLFTIEVFIKVIACGLLFNGNKSYLRSLSNVLDLFVVIISWIQQLLTNRNLSFVKIIRMAKLARPMRLIFRNENLKISIKVLGIAIPDLLRLAVLSLIIFMIFGVIGTKLFKGKLFHCENAHIKGINHKNLSDFITDQYSCINFGGEWVRWHTHFDNIWNATLQMSLIAQTVGWDTTMIRFMKATGINEAPLEHQPFGIGSYSALFFIVWVIFGCFFMLNMFAGVLVSAFNRESERQGEKMLLTEQQKQKLETVLFTMKVKPFFVYERPKNKCRSCIFSLVYTEDKMEEEKRKKKWKKPQPGQKKTKQDANKGVSQTFDIMILVVIFINTLALMLKWPNMNQKLQLFLEIVNHVCTGVFILEAIFKIIAFGRSYFKDTWNIFDLIIVIGSLVFIAPSFKRQKRTITMMRAFRIGRVFKLFKQFKQLKSIFVTIEYTMSAMLNVGMLMMLIIYLFAVIGVQLFADIKINEPMSELTNFQTLPKAYLTLYMVLTRDRWNDLLEALSLEKSAQNFCLKSPTYQDYISNGHQPIGCGKRTIASFYFSAFSFIVPIVFLSLFVAILLSGYFSSNEKNKKETIKGNTLRFQRAWALFDPKAIGVIQYEDIDLLLKKLDQPLGWDKTQAMDPQLCKVFKAMIAINMPQHQKDPLKQWYFNEVLDQLMFYYIVGRKVWKELIKKRIKMDMLLFKKKRLRKF